MNIGGKEQNFTLLPLPNCVHRQFTHQSRSLNFIAKLDCNSRKIVTHVTYHFSTHFLRQTVSKIPFIFIFTLKNKQNCNSEFSQKNETFLEYFQTLCCYTLLPFHFSSKRFIISQGGTITLGHLLALPHQKIQLYFDYLALEGSYKQIKFFTSVKNRAENLVVYTR